MDDFNSIVLEGNVVRDPEARETAKGVPICMFSIAVNKTYRTSQGERRQEVSFFDIETWGTLAASCSSYCTKGRGVRVVGRLKQNRWQDTEGKNHSKIRIVAEHVDFKPRFSGQKEKSAVQDGVKGTDSPAAGVSVQREMADLAEAAWATRAALEMRQPALCEAVF